MKTGGSVIPLELGALQVAAANEPHAGDLNGGANSVGVLLRTAREKAGLSAGDVAARLRMGIKQVQALELDDFAALPQGTFLRGFVRNFAKEVGVSPEQALGVLEEVHQAAAAISASAVVMPSQQNISVPAPGGEFATPRTRALIGVAIASFLIGVVWYWWEFVRPYRAEGGRPKAAEEKTASIPMPAPPLSKAAAPSETVESTDGKVVTQAALRAEGNLQPGHAGAVEKAEPAGMASAATEPVSAVAVSRQVQAPGQGLLGFTFGGESWIEVVDRTGKTVLSRRYKSGEAEEIVGVAPFSIVIGNAHVTRMAYNGKEVDLVPHTRVSVARLTVK